MPDQHVVGRCRRCRRSGCGSGCCSVMRSSTPARRRIVVGDLRRGCVRRCRRRPGRPRCTAGGAPPSARASAARGLTASSGRGASRPTRWTASCSADVQEDHRAAGQQPRGSPASRIAPPPSDSTPSCSASAAAHRRRAPGRGSAPRPRRRRCRRSSLPCGGLDVGVGVPVDGAEPVGEHLADRGLAGPGRADEDDGSRRRSPDRPGCRGSRATLRRVSVTVSPPNFSATASASTRATMASATMPAAGTAHTSERWWWALAASPVAHVDGGAARAARSRWASSRRAPAAARRWSSRPRCRRSGR